MSETLAKEGFRKIAFWYCDIDNFKLFNESFGYEAGDQLLKSLAQPVSYTHLDVYKRQDMNQVYDQLKTNGYAVIGGQVNSPEDLKNMITGLNDKYPGLNINWGDCPVITPPGENTPDTDQPDSDGGNTGTPDIDPVSYTHLDVYKRQT